MNRVFADTSYFIAIIVPDDAGHAFAAAFSKESLHLVTSAWVMTELAAYLSAPDNRELFNNVLSALRNSNLVTFMPVTQELFDRAADLYAARGDKSWSLVDCTSFLIMQRENLSDALTSDHHFVQAGFNALLINKDK
jgi:predicted nucleic acid-binding protein